MISENDQVFVDNLRRVMGSLSESHNISSPIWLLHSRYRYMTRIQRSKALKNDDEEPEILPEDPHVGVEPMPQPQHHEPRLVGSRFTAAAFPPLPENKLYHFLVIGKACGIIRDNDSFEEVKIITEGVEDILEALKCPVCMEVSFPPIWSCVNGHIVCNRCCKHLMELPLKEYETIVESKRFKCPTCRETQRIPGRKIEAEEHCINVLRFRCFFSEKGCGRVLGGGEFVRHITMQCRFRTWTCPFCETKLDLTNCRDHFLYTHSNNHCGFGLVHTLPRVLASFRMSVPLLSNNEHLRFAFGFYYQMNWNKLFVIYQIRTATIEYFWCVCLIGTQEEADDFSVDISLESYYDMGVYLPRETQVHEWKGVKVISIQNSIGSIAEKYSKRYRKNEDLVIADFGYSLSRRVAHRVTGALQIQINRINSE